jgi:hypothetical protein
VEGGTLVRIFGTEWGCLRRGINASLSCCASQLAFSCLFGGVSVPAVFIPEHQAVECVSPPVGGSTVNSTVTLELTESGRRIATANNMLFTYNTTNVGLVSANATEWYNSDHMACITCAGIYASWLQSVTGGEAGMAAFCATDCSGEFRGAARLDGCLVCSGGGTSHAAESDRDCRGQCFGPFQALDPASASSFSEALDKDLNGLVDECICVERIGQQSCAYYASVDGPVQASEVMILLPYEALLVSMSVATIVAGALWHLARYIKRRQQVAAAAVPEGAGPEVVVAAAGGGGVAGGAAAEAGVVLVVPPPPRAAAAPSGLDAFGLMGVAGGLEAQPPPRARDAAAQARRERRRAERAAAASPGMSAAAAAAMADDGPSISGRSGGNGDAAAHNNPPASHYRFNY